MLRNVICMASRDIKILNAPCSFRTILREYCVECLWTPLDLSFALCRWESLIMAWLQPFSVVEWLEAWLKCEWPCTFVRGTLRRESKRALRTRRASFGKFAYVQVGIMKVLWARLCLNSYGVKFCELRLHLTELRVLTSNLSLVRLPAEFKHIIKRRKRN